MSITNKLVILKGFLIQPLFNVHSMCMFFLFPLFKGLVDAGAQSASDQWGKKGGQEHVSPTCTLRSTGALQKGVGQKEPPVLDKDS